MLVCANFFYIKRNLSIVQQHRTELHIHGFEDTVLSVVDHNSLLYLSLEYSPLSYNGKVSIAASKFW